MFPMIPIRTAILASPETRSSIHVDLRALARVVWNLPTLLTHPESTPKEAQEANHRLLPGEAMSPEHGPQEDSPVQLRAPP